ncbi:Hypothetical protein CINCED_3A010229 [Cinara cedri]|nr:Hypothetical protein CINCED_3A010229 [Cinara cedri]
MFIWIITYGVIIHGSFLVMAIDSDSMSSQIYSNTTYKVYRGSQHYARIAEPITGVMNLSEFEFKPTSKIFGITKDGGIVYVKNCKELKKSTQTNFQQYIWYIDANQKNGVLIKKSVILNIEMMSDKMQLDCNEVSHCSNLQLDTKFECISSCGIGSNYKCQWRESPSPEMFTTNYSTCTPDINSCPNGYCDSLEKMNYLICPQDCADKDEIFGTGTGGKKAGILRATGVCTCDEFGKCTCEKKVIRPKTTNLPNKIIKSTTPTLGKQEDTSVCDGYWCDHNVNMSIAIVILFVKIGILMIYCRNKILKSSKKNKNVRKPEELLPMRDQHGHHPNPVSNSNTFITDFDQKWEFPRENLVLKQEIGEGEFGKVLKAHATDIHNIKGESIVAVKTVKNNAGTTEKNDLLSEYNLLKDVNHPNVVKLLGACTTQDGPFYLIIEYAKYGSLRSYLRKSRIQDVNSNGLVTGNFNRIETRTPIMLPLYPISPKDILKFAWQISKGMSYLAELKLVHRDLAARNVLLTEDKMCKISDFGLTRDVYEDNTYLKKTKGRVPVKWMAPESLADHIYTSRSDVWSFGILLWELVTLGAVPYPGIAVQDLFKLLKEGYRMAKPEHCSHELYDIMVACWADDQHRRPNFKSLTTSLEKMLEKGNDYLQLDFKQFVNNMCYLMDDYEVLDQNQTKAKGTATEEQVTYEIPKSFNELGTTYVMMKDFTFDPNQQLQVQAV